MKMWSRVKKTMALATIFTMAAVYMGTGTQVYAEETKSTETTNTDTTTTDTATTTENVPIASPSYAAGDSAYVCLGSTYQTQSVSAGQDVTLVIPIVNYCYAPVNNLVIAPQVSNLASQWPFEPNSTGYTQSVPAISANYDGADVNSLRADVTYHFKVRSDALTGYYPLNFTLSYQINDQMLSSTVTAYIYVKGAAGSGTLDGASDSSTNSSKPRIIVTGFETDPERVCAGDTFTLTVHVKNTSNSTSVSNVLFDMQADQETTSNGTNSTSNSYAAFLPTSGSSSMYESSIGAGASKDLKIEMTARGDLTQKPYVLDVKMTYDAAGSSDITDMASVSIPIYQESRFDTGEEEISTDYAFVGEGVDLSFSIYNTGKTTLNNVWFKWKDDAVEGEDVYVGTITSGSTGYVDASMTALAANEDGEVTAEITYEDESGNVTSVEKTFQITISDEGGYYEEDTSYIDDEYMEDNQSGLPIKGIVAAVLAVIVAVIAIVFFRKKKKAKAEDDFDDELDGK